MKDPKKEVARLLNEPVVTEQGAISVNQEFQIPFIQLKLVPFPGHSHERMVMFTSAEWVRFLEVIEAHLNSGRKKSKKKGEKQ